VSVEAASRRFLRSTSPKACQAARRDAASTGLWTVTLLAHKSSIFQFHGPPHPAAGPHHAVRANRSIMGLVTAVGRGQELSQPGIPSRMEAGVGCQGRGNGSWHLWLAQVRELWAGELQPSGHRNMLLND
jgi:hypothetical protein